jgi:hypothetical protein
LRLSSEILERPYTGEDIKVSDKNAVSEIFHPFSFPDMEVPTYLKRVPLLDAFGKDANFVLFNPEIVRQRLIGKLKARRDIINKELGERPDVFSNSPDRHDSVMDDNKYTEDVLSSLSITIPNMPDGLTLYIQKKIRIVSGKKEIYLNIQTNKWDRVDRKWKTIKDFKEDEVPNELINMEMYKRIEKKVKKIVIEDNSSQK